MAKEEEQDSPARTLGRNDRCHCDSGKKYKQCCLAEDEAAAREAREARAKQAEAAAAEAEAESEDAPAEDESHERKRKDHQKQTHQPWKRSKQQAGGQQKHTLPRKVGS